MAQGDTVIQAAGLGSARTPGCTSKTILDAPNLETRAGIRDYAIFQLMLDTGMRVSELTGLRIEDLTLEPTAAIFIREKGRKERSLPLWKETTTNLCLI